MNRILYLSDTSKFKRAHDWPGELHFLAEVVNAINGLRADLCGIQYKQILGPSAQRELDAKRAAVRAAHDDVMAQLRGASG